ncbi:hypothetical protein C8R47DRAFT_1116736 [Mycena vitilis]|nr:hypothetical protein C8R47DRAFT_1116736 [Mycena vitilis]
MSNTQNAKEQLAAHFDNSATAVRTYADQFEKSYARPALKTTSAFFDKHPISSTYLVIFSSLSFFPVLTFIALSVFTIVSLSFLALSIAFVISSVIVLVFLALLALCLVTIFFASGFFTVLVISTYLGYRFVTLVRSDGRGGVSNWAVETKDRFIQSKRREASDESAVVVDSKEPRPEDSFGTESDVKQQGF